MKPDFPTVDEQIDLLKRGCEAIYSEADLRERLESCRREGRPLRVKLGLDPTAPDIHLGHTVVLQKMRQFQDCGHRAVLIIGDFTSRIGDPTGRTKTRPVLDDASIKANAKTYFEQAGHVLDTSEDKLEIRYNSEWLADLDLVDILRLTGHVTVAQMIQRESFKKRLNEGVDIAMTELLYPLMQGYDSVMIDADVELGGTDQTFNNLLGRDLMGRHGKPKQVVIIMPILRGLDGVEKMSKSLGNYIGITDGPKDMFGKTMRIDDGLMPEWYALLTNLPRDEIENLCDPARTHPREAKVRLAKTIVAQFHDEAAADAEEELWQKVMVDGGMRDDIPNKTVSDSLVKPGAGQDAACQFDKFRLVVECGFAASNSEARRLIRQKGIRLNDDVVTERPTEIAIRHGDILRRGKREACRLQLEPGGEPS